MRIDLKKDSPQLYRPGTEQFTEVDVPEICYLAVDGRGNPNTSPRYAAAVGALYAAAYAIRAAVRNRTGDDFVVGPLEGLWSSTDPSSFVDRRKDEWDWTMLIPLPALATAADIAGGLVAAAARKPPLPVSAVRPVRLTEGRCLQILHIGSYDDEADTLARLHDEVMPALGLTFNGPHHEIYLNDPRRVPPDRLRTVLRQPVRPISPA